MYERFLGMALSKTLGFEYRELRRWEHFENTFSKIILLGWAFVTGCGKINLCVGRLLLPILLRNLFNRNRVISVWHYHDPNDGQGKVLHLYYLLTFFIARFFSHEKLAIVVVAPYWKIYFQKRFPGREIFYFPNLIERPANILPVVKHEKRIHLGQVSFKNSPELFKLAENLHYAGYSCYFSTNLVSEVSSNPFYEIRYFETHEAFLNYMATAEYTLAMPAFNEGWNRVAHESLLVGTQVIGFDRGGLGDLLKGANAILVETVEEAFTQIQKHEKRPIRVDYLEKISPVNLEFTIKEIKNWAKLDKIHKKV